MKKKSMVARVVCLRALSWRRTENSVLFSSKCVYLFFAICKFLKRISQRVHHFLTAGSTALFQLPAAPETYANFHTLYRQPLSLVFWQQTSQEWPIIAGCLPDLSRAQHDWRHGHEFSSPLPPTLSSHVPQGPAECQPSTRLYIIFDFSPS